MLTLEEGEGVTALTGVSDDFIGRTVYLDVTTSAGKRWKQGDQTQGSDYSRRAPPILGGTLSHLSGCKTIEARVLCCHWTRG